TANRAMNSRQTAKEASHSSKRYRVTRADGFRLKDCDPADTGSIPSKGDAEKLLATNIELLSELQEKLYAQDRWAILLIFQGVDAAGKDSVIKHVMSGVNPQGCDVFSFKTPTVEELGHDYLWRTHVRVPERGKIGIFNRSYYEEVLIVRVHSEVLAAQKLPNVLVTKRIWDERYEDINNFERFLSRNGIVIRKFFLHISKKEQKKRFLHRLDDPKKNWKIQSSDLRERRFWKDYHKTYEEMIRRTSTRHAPWYVVPGDSKWFARLVVSSAIVETLADLNLAFPKIDKAKKKELAKVRRALRG
ncbi:MAG TPA: polyphosphate kinase 2 family protein, partial [Candidatus Acidoferrales bacterium]|nr:polyphosphate kinase 2 family protein [Candidatus Acidoferrales bacterium]